ncbi:IS4 family transposase [bacterium]|nr:IS4 family transposase [bacterium]
MGTSISNSGLPGSRNFDLIKDSMLQSDELPLAEVLADNQWQDIFDAYEIDFGSDEEAIYTPAITLWALISQAFFKEEMRSCKAAVGRVASLWATLGKTVCDTNTGAYCRARSKISWQAVRDICCQIAEATEAIFDAENIDPDLEQHDVVADVGATPGSGRILLFDGFTITAADTPETQEEFPQNPAQKEGVGFPIIRGVSLISMVTGLLIDLELGPYAGKQSGETALLWKMLDHLNPGDTLVADCYLCTYWIVAACKTRGVNIVMKNHDKRDDDPVGATRIDKHQRTTVWLRPQRPNWMSGEEYSQCPERIEIRLVDVVIDQPGFRSKKYTIATTILETKAFSRDWITSVYRSRWLVELDIRAIKCSLGMDIIRAKTPAMVQTEIWSCLLAYNLIRMKMLQSCAANGRMPRTLSFTTTQQLLANNWLLASVMLTKELIELGQQTSSSEVVGNRLDRVEPRANKRRPKVLALLKKPRHIAKLDLAAAAA